MGPIHAVAFIVTPILFHQQDGGSTTKALRLRRFNETRSGQVEIYHGGSWETICFDGWDVHDAFVACRQLGYSGADGIKHETPANVQSSLKNVRCKGNENTLGDCIHDWSVGNCNHGYAGVICSGMFWCLCHCSKHL